MSTPTILTGTVNAFITSSYKTLDYVRESDNPVGELTYAASHMIGFSGWIHIGTADITVTLSDETHIVAKMVESLDAQIQNTYAEAESKINLLKEKKQSLLAITMELTK